MNLINCDLLERVPQRTYGGRSGSKIAVRYNDEVHMLKCAESARGKNFSVTISYANDCVSEYIGSHVYEIAGIPVHQTLLGVYNGKQCVLCKDIAYPNNIVEFRQLRNTIMDDTMLQDSSGMSNNLEDIFEVIDRAEYIPREQTWIRFWNMFVIDAIIGNCDRNNGNWGYLLTNNYLYTLAPVYDCGGSLNKWKSDDQIVKMSEAQKYSIAINSTVNFYERSKIINPFQYMEMNIDNKYIKESIDVALSISRTKVWDMLSGLIPVISEQRMHYYQYLIDTRLDRLSSIYSSKSSIMSSLLKQAEGNKY